MPVAPIMRVEQFGDTVVADRDVGRNRCSPAGARLARHNPEFAAVRGVDGRGGNVPDADGVYPRERRGVGTEPMAELGHRRASSLNLDEYRARVVPDESGQAELAGNPVDERTEANPLHNTGHGEP